MSSIRRLLVAPLLLLAGCVHAPLRAGEVCPARDASLRFVDVFDGKPEELAYLMPDEAGARSGFWSLAYVYDAGRIVTVRCKYADGQAVDVPLPGRVQRCDYRLDAAKTLAVNCK